MFPVVTLTLLPFLSVTNITVEPSYYLNRAKKLSRPLLLDSVLADGVEITGDPETVPLDAMEWTDGVRPGTGPDVLDRSMDAEDVEPLRWIGEVVVEGYTSVTADAPVISILRTARE